MGWSSGAGWAGVRLLVGPTISGNVLPESNDGGALGSTTLSFSDLFLASGGVINWNAGDVTLTHSANTLTLGGGTLAMGGNAITGMDDTSTVNLGASTSTGTLWAVASVNTTAVGNVDDGADDLMTYTLPANTLNATTKAIRITARFTGAANANSKTMTFVFGSSSTAIFINSGSANTYYINFVIARSGLNTQDIWGDRWESGGPSGNGLARITATETETGAITIKFTGTATATDDIVQRLMIVEVCNG